MPAFLRILKGMRNSSGVALQSGSSGIGLPYPSMRLSSPEAAASRRWRAISSSFVGMLTPFLGRGPPPRSRPAFGASRSSALALRALTFDMRGGRKQAKPDCGRPLDGRVRHHLSLGTADGTCFALTAAHALAKAFQE